MDILDFQKRLNDFMISQVTQGLGNTAECDALRADLDAAIAEYGDQIPQLKDLANQLDLLKAVSTDQNLANQMAEDLMKDYVPEPEIFQAIDDSDLAGVEAALSEWDVNRPHGEFDKTALYAAMSNMFGLSIPIVTLLLDKGADPKRGIGEGNVLHGLGFARCDALDPSELAKVITRCVTLGADLEQRSENLGWTPLITAASEWNPVATEALLIAGADIAARSGEVPGVFGAGQTAMAFVSGHDATRAVLERHGGERLK